MNRAVAEVNAEFKRLREKRSMLIESRQNEIYDRIPEIAGIDMSIWRAGTDIIGSASSGAVTAEMAADEFSHRLMELIQKKKQLLLKNGFEEDYLNPPYFCATCKDTGVNDGGICSCYRKKLEEKLFESSGLGIMMQDQTFSNFDISLFSDEKINGVSPRENMTEILETSKSFVRNFKKENKNLLFYGASGLGKTYLSSAIANELIKREADVLYQSAGNIFSALDNIRFGKANEEERYLASRFEIAELLIIDDLGTEFISTLSVSEFFRILNSRILNGRSTIISTNLSLRDINKIYSDRIFSRIIGHFEQCKFIGKDIRVK